jgi:D-alanyl-D-alanine endopeptidase (penicillin-binding protein 7)
VVQHWINRSDNVASTPKQLPQPSYNRPTYVNPRGKSFGQLAGLHQTIDPLSLSAGSVMVEEEMTGQPIFSKNAAAVLPIASITKLMTALVTLDARLPMTDIIVIDESDVDTLKGSSSRLRVGTRLTRAEALLLALMSSENRAAHALARTHPLGIQAFVQLMNQKARQINMINTYFTDPTGLSSNNRSTASDLAKMVKTAYQQPVIRQFSTSTSYQLQTEYGLLNYRNTNPLVGSSTWNVNVSKTGYISEAGRCLVMHVQVLGRNFVFVLLDAIGKSSRVNDAIRIRQWIEQVLTAQTVGSNSNQ